MAQPGHIALAELLTNARLLAALRAPGMIWAALLLAVGVSVTAAAWYAAAASAAVEQQTAVLICLAGLLTSLLASSVVGATIDKRAQAIEAKRRQSADFTRRREVEEQLRRSELTFRLLFADSPLPMWLYDRATLRFVDVNNAASVKYGYSLAEFHSMRVSDIRAEDGSPAREFRGSAQGIERYVGEWRHKLRDGTIINVEVTAHDIEHAGRSLTLDAIHDITDRKKAQ